MVGSTFCLVYARASEWTVAAFDTAFQKKLRDVVPKIWTRQGVRVSDFKYFGCREQHGSGSASHWSVVVLVRLDKRIHRRDAMASFALEGFGEQPFVWVPRAPCYDKSREFQGLEHWYRTVQACIACAPEEEQFGELVWQAEPLS
jgi:hypothetical protein